MKRALFLIPIAIITLAIGAFADAINVELREVYLDSVVAEVHFDNLYGWPAGEYNGLVYAGLYTLEIKGDGWSGFYNGFCVDPSLSTNDFADYQLVPITNADEQIVAAVYDKYKDNPAKLINVQLAVWQFLFGSHFSIINYGSTNQAIVTSILDELKNPDQSLLAFNASAQGYMLASSNGYGQPYQDYVIRVGVPEPGLLSLLGIAFAAIGMLWKRVGA